jgi:hypothetical protein
MSPTLNSVLEFLAHLFHNGIGYSGINTARSALSTFISVDGIVLDEVSEKVNVFFFCRTVVSVMFLLQVTSWDNPLAAEVFWETKSVSAITVQPK